MENITRTVYSAHLQTCQLLQLPYLPLVNTTLNEKFNVNVRMTLNPGEIPAAKYMAIGRGGVSLSIGNDNTPVLTPMQHQPTDAALFDHIPFILRPVTDDLSSEDRLKYRLRVIRSFGGVSYACYYLKVLDLSSTTVELNNIVVNNNTTTITTFTPTLANLNPTPAPLVSEGQNITTGEYVSASAVTPFNLTSDDINEILNSCQIMYNNTNYALISELGVCSGIDRIISGNFNGTTSSYTEVGVAQIMSFVNVFYAASFANSGIDLELDIGNTEPMLALQ